MKILLVTPPYDLWKQGYGSKRILRAGFFPPLGIGYLAAPLLKKGHQIKIVDAPPLAYKNEDILREALLFNANIVGVSSLTASAAEAYDLIKFLKEKMPGVSIILGGMHATCFPEMTFEKVPNLDCLVYGEGEKAFEEIVESIEQTGKIRDDISSTWMKLPSGELRKNPPAEPIMNLDEILPPAWELYDHKIYRPLPLQYKKWPVANIITSRGCPWGRCTFCFESGRASQKYRRCSPQRAIEEIKTLVLNFGIQEVTFWDDNFLINEQWVNEFCDLLDKEKIDIPWSACARVNTVSKSMLERAKKAGCWCIFYGFETGNADLLLRIKKGATLEQAEQAVGWTHGLEIDTRGSFMLALPGETPEKAMNTIKFAIKLNVTFAQFLNTYPEWGTELHDDAIKSGKIMHLYKGRTAVTYVPDGYKNAEEVRMMQKKAYHLFYYRWSFIAKHLQRLIKNPRLIKQYWDGIKYVLGVSS